MNTTNFESLVGSLRQTLSDLPDHRRGKNKSYRMEDFGLCAFSVFFTQSPSFLAYQKTLQETRAQNNASSLFQVADIPSDNQIRSMLDPVSPDHLYPVYDRVYETLLKEGVLETWRGPSNSLFIALDGTWYQSSDKIHCDCCSHIEHASGGKTYYHSAVTPVIVAAGKSQVLALRPEFITPQDGQSKQDCEIAASKRWLQANAHRYLQGAVTLLGDDLYAHQPFCRQTLLHGYHFLFVCKPDSHKTLTSWVGGLAEGRNGLGTLKTRIKVGSQFHTYCYRWARQVPLVDGDDALKVNWLELVVTDKDGAQVYRNSWITDWPVDEKTVEGLAAWARSRWSIENGNNNTLKTKGYHLEHNFGHGKKHLASVLATLNILAFLFHTVLEYCDQSYRLIRAKLPTRQTFFDDLRALTRYMFFADWHELMHFMMRGLEIGPYAKGP